MGFLLLWYSHEYIDELRADWLVSVEAGDFFLGGGVKIALHNEKKRV